MNDWFRSWHGAPTDPKWLVIARNAGATPLVVAAVAWALFDHASQAEDRGAVADFDFESFAVLMGADEAQVRAVYAAMEGKGVIVGGRLAKWEKRQPRREDPSAADRQDRRRRKPEPEPVLPLDTDPQLRAKEVSAAVEPSLTPAAETVSASAIPSPPTVGKVTISATANRLADDIARECGYEIEHVPPSWCGAALRVQMWLDDGWRPDIILASARAQLVHKRDGPPSKITYFEKGILRAHADAGSPLPSLKIVERQGEVIHVAARTRQGSSGLAAADRLLDQLAAASSAEGKS
jgi:hypothetical protein